MGAKHSLDDDLITFRLTKKQMERSALKCEKNQKVQMEKLKEAMRKGNIEGAKIYAENVIREKNQALNFLKLGSRLDAVAARIETAVRMQTLSKAMEQTVKSMNSAMQTMDSDKLARVMEQFEKNFENMDVQAGYMESSMAASTAMATPPDQVQQLMEMAATEAGLDMQAILENAGQVGVGTGSKLPASASPESDLEARFNALKK